MSSFCGQMKEYKCVSIDCFDTCNLSSTAFFLSHCHSDHMRGLNSQWFIHSLKSLPNIYLYCSTITKQLLINFGGYDDVIPYVKVLPYDEAIEVFVPSRDGGAGQKIHVTLIEANHCPGSVMFLFEGCEGTALYTGDFRFDTQQLHTIQSLHYPNNGKVKKIHSAYVDTTFCVPEAMFIPSREQTAEAVIKVISDWLNNHPHNLVVLDGKARIGYEFLYAILYERFNMKIHVSDEKLDRYKDIPAIMKYVTGDETTTRIHSCVRMNGRKNRRLKCQPASKDGAVLTMVLSTMWFTQTVNGFDNICVIKDGRHRVCCSFHSSYTEVREFVSYIRPENVYPNVEPMNYPIEWVQQRLDLFKLIAMTTDSSLSQTVRPLGRLRKRKPVNIQPKPRSSSMESDNLLLSESPVSKKTKRQSFNKNESRHSNSADSSFENDRISNEDGADFNDAITNSQISYESKHSTDSGEESGSELDLFSDQESEAGGNQGFLGNAERSGSRGSEQGGNKTTPSSLSLSFLTYLSDHDCDDVDNDDDDGIDDHDHDDNHHDDGCSGGNSNIEYQALIEQNRLKTQEQESEEFSQLEEIVGCKAEKVDPKSINCLDNAKTLMQHDCTRLLSEENGEIGCAGDGEKTVQLDSISRKRKNELEALSTKEAKQSQTLQDDHRAVTPLLFESSIESDVSVSMERTTGGSSCSAGIDESPDDTQLYDVYAETDALHRASSSNQKSSTSGLPINGLTQLPQGQILSQCQVKDSCKKTASLETLPSGVSNDLNMCGDCDDPTAEEIDNCSPQILQQPVQSSPPSSRTLDKCAIENIVNPPVDKIEKPDLCSSQGFEKRAPQGEEMVIIDLTQDDATDSDATVDYEPETNRDQIDDVIVLSGQSNSRDPREDCDVTDLDATDDAIVLSSQSPEHSAKINKYQGADFNTHGVVDKDTVIGFKEKDIPVIVVLSSQESIPSGKCSCRGNEKDTCRDGITQSPGTTNNRSEKHSAVCIDSGIYTGKMNNSSEMSSTKHINNGYQAKNLCEKSPLVPKPQQTQCSPVFDRHGTPPIVEISSQSPDFLIYHSPESCVPTDSQISDVHVQYAKGNFLVKNSKKKINFDST